MCWPTSTSPAPATDRQRRSTAASSTLLGSALGFRNLTGCIARSLLETGEFRPQLHPALGYASEGGDARDQLRASDPAAVDVGETWQLTLNLNPGGICFVVCGGVLCQLLFELSSVSSAVAAHGLRR
jgi:hypothetical protein